MVATATKMAQKTDLPWDKMSLQYVAIRHDIMSTDIMTKFDAYLPSLYSKSTLPYDK